MRRVPVLLSSVAVTLRGLAATPAGAGHLLVGAWLLTLPNESRAGPRLNSYTGDVIALQTHPAGSDAQGA